MVLVSKNNSFININRILVFGYKIAVDFMFSAGTRARIRRRVKQFTFTSDGQYFQLYLRTFPVSLQRSEPGTGCYLHFDFAFGIYSILELSNISASCNNFSNTSGRDTEISNDQKMLLSLFPILILFFSVAWKFY